MSMKDCKNVMIEACPSSAAVTFPQVACQLTLPGKEPNDTRKKWCVRLNSFKLQPK